MTITLGSPVTMLPLIGEAYAKKLEGLGIETIEDLLWHVPVRYLDTREVSKIADVRDDGQSYVISGTITKAKSIYTRRRLFIFEVVAEDTSGKINIVWFNQSYLGQTLIEGSELLLYGKAKLFGKKLVLQSPDFEIIYEKGKTRHLGIVAPIYHLTYGVSQKWLRGRIRFTVDLLGKGLKVRERLSKNVLVENNLIKWVEAFKQIHLPEASEKLELARKTLAFEELFGIMLKIIKRKTNHQKNKAPKIKLSSSSHTELTSKLPYTLTLSQKQSIMEIFKDLERAYPMDRLLVGDVGSGKTIVAVAAAIQVLRSGYNVLLMAPTAILATQHFKTIKGLLKHTPYSIELVLGKTASSQPSVPIHSVTSSQTPVLYIGTHALLHHQEYTTNVGLVIVDEQHRFGVKQRDQLLSDSEIFSQLPHRLTLTATPIPRTMALVFFGDQEISYLTEMPAGRIKVISKHIKEKTKPKLYDVIRQKLTKEGSQLFVVCPLIEESEKLQAKAVETEYKVLLKTFPEFSIELLHGRLKVDEKDSVLEGFRKGKTRILVTTPVIEVGIDIPEADLMLIEGAERFGLAQLHQLRGRIGRGAKQSYCFVTTTVPTKNAIDRITYFCKTNDGLKLAEFDLANRGPGEVYGYKQAGLPELKIARLDDLELIKSARKAAEQYLKNTK